MNDPLSAAGRWAIVVCLAALVLVRSAAGPDVTRIAVLGLAGFALVPMVGWLRTLWFMPVAAAGLAAWTAAVLLHRGHAVVVVIVLASAVGAAVGATAAALVRQTPPPARPWWSLLGAAAVWAVLLPETSIAAASAPLLFGIEMGSERALALTAVALLAAAMWATTHVARTRAGREIAAAGSAADLALRCGVDLRAVWLRAGAVSGLFASWAGFVHVLEVQNVPPATHFSPAAAVVWLAVPLLGGPAWASGALVGALVVGGVAAVLPVSDVTVAGIAVAAVAVFGSGDGMVAALRRVRGGTA